MSGHPIKYRDGSWQVQIHDGIGGPQWIRVDSDADAYKMSACLELMDAALEVGPEPEGEAIAQELEQCAALFSKYGCHDETKHIIEYIKFARGQPSALDKHYWD